MEFAHLVHFPERRAFFKLQAVDADVVGGERERFVDVRLEHGERLARQAVHEIEVDVREASRAGETDGLPRLFRRVDAADASEEVVVERLDAEGETGDGVGFQERQLFFIDRAGVAFDCELHPSACPTFDTPTTASRSPSLKEGGWSLRAFRA